MTDEKNDFSDFEDDFFPQDFAPEPEYLEVEITDKLPIDVTGVDLMRPTGFVGQIADWIDSQCRYPRRRLAVASAIVSIGNIGGLRHEDERDGVTANMLAFCVAASATGKEAVQQAMAEVHIAAGVQSAMQGAIKSEQEILRNLIEHQSAYYVVDEIGIFLKKVQNAQKSGGASYLEGVIGAIMASYSKANSRMLLGGDIKRELRKTYAGALARAQDKDDDIGAERAQAMLDMADKGLFRPFLSVVGFTTPSTFDGIMNGENATSGFVGRSLIVTERDINPSARKNFKKPDMPMMMGGRLGLIYGGSDGRVEFAGDRSTVKTTDDASAALTEISEWLIHYAEEMGEKTGEASVAMIRRSYEMIAKVSFVLAIPDGERNIEHVRWAFAYVKDELDTKIKLVFANDNARTKPEAALGARLLNYIDPDKGSTISVLANRSRATVEDVNSILNKMAEAGEVFCDHKGKKYRGKVVERWRLV